MSSPRVSVLMANYNGDRFLAAAIESILSQSFTDFEMIIVDDGSSDKSALLLASYARKDKRIRAFYLPKNRGLAHALNYGLGFSRGEYVARMDSDDMCHRDRLREQISYMDRHAEIHILGCHYRAINEEGSFCSAEDARRIREPLALVLGRCRVAKRVLLGPYPIFHPTIVCRRSTLLSVGGYREFFPIGEDDDLYFRIVNLHGGVLDNLPEKLYYYRRYSGSTTQRFSRSFSVFIISLIALSSEFRRRGFWDPLEEHPSSDCGSLRFRGVSSFLYLQDSLIFLPYYPREGLYSLLRVVVILRRFELKDFHDISLLNELGMTMDKQIYFYTLFCKLCFRLQKFRAGFLYFRYIISLYRRVSFLTILSSFFTIIFSFITVQISLIYSSIYSFITIQIPLIYSSIFSFITIQIPMFINFTKRRSDDHLFLSRSLIFTSRWYYGMKHLFTAFCYNPFFVTKFFLTRFYVHSLRIMYVLYRKVGF